MDNEEKLRRKFAKVELREWAEIQSLIIKYPEITNTPGQAPEVEINDLIEVQNLLDKTKSSNPIYEEETSSILITSFIKEGIFQIQRANHLLSLANVGLKESFGCPSLPIFYQCAYTCADGILKMHGVHKATKKGSKNQWILDIFMDVKKKDRVPVKATMRVIDLDGLGVNHKEFWQLFYKTVSKTVYSEDLKPTKEAIKALDPSTFMIQRNYLNYQTTFWPFDELIGLEKVASFRDDLKGKKHLFAEEEVDHLDPRFLPLFACGVVQFANELLKQISARSKAFEEELTVVQNYSSAFGILS